MWLEAKETVPGTGGTGKGVALAMQKRDEIKMFDAELRTVLRTGMGLKTT